MSRKGRSRAAARLHAPAPIFAALGDATRLLLVAKLSSGQTHSIAQLTAGSKLTRQAITKHLRVMESVGIVHCVRKGRERLFALDPEPIQEIQGYLGRVSEQWDQALGRLKSFVENCRTGEEPHSQPRCPVS